MRIPPAALGMPRALALRWIRPCLWLAPLVAALVIAVLAESRAQPASSEEAFVDAAETKLSEALAAADKSAARKLLSLQFSFVDENGKVFQRKEFLSDLKSVAASEAPSDVKVSVYGLVGMVTGSRKSALGKSVFFLDIWAKQKGSWRALTMQNVVLGGAEAANSMSDESSERDARSAIAKAQDCKNPCETIPYRVRSPAEQEVVTAFQSIEKATVAHDADEWAKHVASEFVHYRSGAPPQSRADRIALIEHEKELDLPAVLTGIQSMRLAVYGDGAAMISANGIPDDTEPLLRIARVWVKRNGRWQLVISLQTDVSP
jgi:Domain of unknown function (DUF4440)